MTPRSAKATQRVYKQMKDNLDHMGKTALQMLRHPDATPDQIDAVRQTYFSAYQSWINARVEILKRFPELRGEL